MEPARLLQIDKKYVMGCLPKRDDVVVVRAKGSTIYDAGGRRYTDLFSGISSG